MDMATEFTLCLVIWVNVSSLIDLGTRQELSLCSMFEDCLIIR